jgi:hypothetical protein
MLNLILLCHIMDTMLRYMCLARRQGMGRADLPSYARSWLKVNIFRMISPLKIEYLGRHSYGQL